MRTEYGVSKVKVVKPALTTSFMPLRGNQIKEYEKMSEKVRGRKNYGSKSIHGASETSPLKT